MGRRGVALWKFCMMVMFTSVVNDKSLIYTLLCCWHYIFSWECIVCEWYNNTTKYESALKRNRYWSNKLSSIALWMLFFCTVLFCPIVQDRKEDRDFVACIAVRWQMTHSVSPCLVHKGNTNSNNINTVSIGPIANTLSHMESEQNFMAAHIVRKICAIYRMTLKKRGKKGCLIEKTLTFCPIQLKSYLI